MWCLGSDKITCKIHPTEQIEVGAGTMGEFRTNYLRILIIGQLFINVSVQSLGIPYFVRNVGLLFIEDLQAPTVPTGWVHDTTTNQNWRVRPGALHNVEFPLG